MDTRPIVERDNGQAEVSQPQLVVIYASQERESARYCVFF